MTSGVEENGQRGSWGDKDVPGTAQSYGVVVTEDPQSYQECPRGERSDESDRKSSRAIGSVTAMVTATIKL